MTITNYDNATKSVKTFAEGATLEHGHRTVRIMSDVWGTEEYAKYWDESEGRVKDVSIAVWEYSRSDAFMPGSATVDATTEVKEKVKKSIYKWALEAAISKLKSEAAIPVKGSVVKVVHGKTAKGTVGTVVVNMMGQYGVGYRSTTERKFGIATSDVKVKVVAKNGKTYDNYRDMVWVWARNVELVEVSEIDMDRAKEMAANEVARLTTKYN